jgi:hypothetical protein
MSLAGRASRGCTIASLCFAGGCASDLFHATDWKTVCDEEPSECASSSKAASSGSGGQGGTGGTSSTSTSNTGGTGGSGGGACLACSDVVQGGDYSMANFCSGSADLYLLLSDCRCSECPIDCAASTCDTPPQEADLACGSCTAMHCGVAYTTCLNDVR